MATQKSGAAKAAAPETEVAEQLPADGEVAVEAAAADAAAGAEPQAAADAPQVQAEEGQLKRAAVLYAFAPGVDVGDAVEAPVAVIDSLVSSGSVDAHPDAVAAAEARGAKLLTLGA